MIFASLLLAASPVHAIMADDEISSLDVSVEMAADEIEHHSRSNIVFVSNPVMQEVPVKASVPEIAEAVFRDDRPQERSPHSARDLNCLAMAVYFEARGEPISGQKAVADVVMNRKKRRGLSSVCAVVNQPKQFSGRSKWKTASGPIWDRAVKIAQESLSGTTHISSTIQFFHASRISPSWGRKVAMRIGAHIFY